MLKDYQFIKLETKESKDAFQKALNLVYADKEISFADLDYLAKKTKTLSLKEISGKK